MKTLSTELKHIEIHKTLIYILDSLSTSVHMDTAASISVICVDRCPGVLFSSGKVCVPYHNDAFETLTVFSCVVMCSFSNICWHSKVTLQCPTI